MLLTTEAAAAFVLAGMNCRELTGYARSARSVARRTAAAVLALVSGVLALEALTFLAWPAVETSPALRDLSRVALRSGLLAASAGLSALLLRGGRSRA